MSVENHKLMALAHPVSMKHLPEPWADEYEERAAILEWEAGLCYYAAEKLAARQTFARLLRTRTEVLA